jgi:chromosome partitioning protein
METEINERDAFKALFAFNQTLDGLSPADVPNLEKPKLNALEFVHEVVARLKAEEQGGRKEEDTATDNVAGAA